MNTPSPRPVTCALIVNQGKLLAVQKAPPSKNAHLWEFAGGKQEENETLEECLRREITEELGLEIDRMQLAGDNLIVDGKYHLHTYLVTIKAEVPIVLTEHLAYKWLTFEELESLPWLDSDREWAMWAKENWDEVVAFE